MKNIENLDNLNNINNELGLLAKEIEKRIETIDELFIKYGYNSVKQSHEDRLRQSQWNCLYINSKRSIDSIQEIQKAVNLVV